MSVWFLVIARQQFFLDTSFSKNWAKTFGECVSIRALKWRSATRVFIFMFWIITNDCTCLMMNLFRECLVNKLNYGILHQLPANSGHIKSKQQTFTLNTSIYWFVYTSTKLNKLFFYCQTVLQIDVSACTFLFLFL